MSDRNNLYRRNGKKVYIKQPEFEELYFVAKLWGDEETMSEIGGAYLFPKDRWQMFYKKMVQPTDGKNFYCLVYTIRDKAIGEVSFHGYDSVTKAARINIKIHHRYRNKGYGTEALRLFLEYYFLEFGGESIIDNTVKTDSAKKVFGNIGFEVASNFRNHSTYRISRNQLLNAQPTKARNVAILAYDNMNITEFNMPFQILREANHLEEKLLEVFSVSNKEEVNLQDNISVKIDKLFDEEIKPDIIIIPGGEGAKEAVKDKNIIKYILANYNECDYLLSIKEGLYFLSRCKMLDGIQVTRVKNIEENMLEGIKNTTFTDNNFQDNGKLIISSNIVGAMEGCLNIVTKVMGEKAEDTISKYLGLK